MDELRGILFKGGASLVGFADLRILPPQMRQDMRFGISIAVALNPGIVAGIKDGPTREYYDESQRARDLLTDLGLAAARFLEGLGHRAVATDAQGMKVDQTTLSTWLQHKTVATRAGLGWIGKCALLVTEEFGSAVRLTSVLTDAELPAAKPIEDSQCGDCAACVDACSAKAPSGLNWRAGMGRACFFDAFACRHAARERARRIGIDKPICGVCIAACPWTREYIDRSR
jgi:epoxyqueuosine reductase